ncbi:hypothetical protein QOZ80_1AG0028540 [Eleusine coracana subsp. coracana]|nr:hypothetical protein QOZ80_1AG0028540 [Eleusine coracana subsp. coracana]
MAPPPSNPHRHTQQLCFVLPILLLSSVAAESTPSFSSHCPSPAPSPDLHTDANDTNALLEHFHFSPGFFSGSGASNLFMPGISGYFSFLPHAVSRTADPAVIHLSSATLTLFGKRAEEHNGTLGFGSYERIYDVAVSFRLDGYYSTTTFELCMVGTGTDTDGPVKRYADLALRLRVPSKPSLVDPFVAGHLEGGVDFETVYLVTYADGDVYKYSEGRATCPAEAATTSARGGFSCAALRSRLLSEYRLRHAQSNSSSLPRLHEPAMIVNQVHCAANGAVRLYAVFSNDVMPWARTNRFAVENQAVVAEGFWDAETRRLCLRACRVELAVSYWSSAAEKLEVRECGIGMSFWFPAVWTVRDRSATAAMLWNGSQAASGDAGVTSDPITASAFQYIIRTTTTTTNLSDVKYSYTQTFLDTATRHYLNANKKTKASFPGAYNFSSYRDFEFRFFADNDEMVRERGQAYPVSIGSAMVDGDELAAEYAFSRHAAAEMKQSRLVNISYGILFQFTAFDRPDCSEIKAEGVYDTETGFLSMLGCRELNVSTDCKVLITVQLTSLEESQPSGHGKGRISSLRDKTDVLYFESRNITLYGMYSEQVSESIWRMDLERIITLASSTLSCAFIVLQILHIKRNRDAALATSITMLAVLALGCAIPLALDLHTLLANRDKQFVELSGSAGLLDLQELVQRAPALIAFVLQLRLLQLAWAGRLSSSHHHRSLGSERRVLQVCLPLYLIGAAVTGVIHDGNSRSARKDPLFGEDPGTLWGALASYAGLATDGFLLPQVVLNAISSESSSARALSPWFYVGGTVIRVTPHVYDVFRARRYVQSARPSYVYANPRDGLFGSAAWDVVVTCGATALAFLLFWQQRPGGDVRRTKTGGY